MDANIFLELNDLTDEQFEELLVLVRKLKAGEISAPKEDEDDEEEVEDEIDRLQKQERERSELAHAKATISDLQAELQAMRAQLQRLKEKI